MKFCKENDTMKKDLRSANQVVLNTDLRLHRSLEEIEKLRSSLKASQTDGKVKLLFKSLLGS